MTEPHRAAAPRWRRWVTIAMAALALGALGLSVVVQLARDAIAERLTRLAAERGLAITWGEIDLPLLGEIALTEVALSRPSDGRVLLTIASVQADVGLLDALAGRRRPGALSLVGGDLHVALVDGIPVGFEGLLRRGAARTSATPEGPSRPLRIALRGWHATVDASLHGVTAERVFIDDLDATLVRGRDRRLEAHASGTVEAAAHRTALRLDLAADGTIDARFASGLLVGFASPWGPLWLGVDGLHRAPDTHLTELTGVGLRHGSDHVGIARLSLRDAGGGDGGGGPIARPRDVTQIAVTDLAIERDGSRLVAGSATIELDPPVGARTLPTPARISAREIGVETRDRTIRGTFDAATLTLDAPWEALAAGDPLAAVATLSLGRPRLTATVADSAPDTGLTRADLFGQLFGRLVDTPHAETTGDTTPSRPDAASADHGGAATRATRATRLLARVRAWQLAVTDGEIDVHDAQGQPLLRLDGFGLTTREVATGLLELSVQAAVRRQGRETGRVDVTVGLDDHAHVATVKGRISGRDLAHQVSRFSDHVDVQPDAAVDIHFSYRRPSDPGAPHRVEGTATFERFTFQYWRVADSEVRDLEGEVRFDLSLYPRARRVVLKLPEIRLGPAHLSAALDVTTPRGGRPRFSARLSLPRQDCGAVARAIPRALIPRLSRLKLRGSMRFDASLDLDLANPRALELAVHGDLDHCEVLRLGPGIDLDGLRRDFVHHPREPERGVLADIRVGRGTDEWVSSEELPELVKATAWITEDRRFFEHGGVRWDLIERALKMDLDHERFVYGGSTVTQQLVKNLYLDRGKTLARKLEEAIIAWQMERVLTKDEILTIYVNVIEYGPDIYGVKHAARFYFNKQVQQLDPLEIAFIMGLKPYPARGYLQWQAGTLKPWWVRRVKHVLGMVAKRTDLLDDDDVAALAPYQPHFRRPDEPITPVATPPATDRGAEPPGAWAPWGLDAEH